MTQIIESEIFANSLRGFLNETFEEVEGIYLDRNTSLEETLADISAEEASTPAYPGGSTISAHVLHVRFYLNVIQDYMRGTWAEKIDWKLSWQKTIVTDEEWEALRQQLRADHRGLTHHINSIADWSNEQRLGGALAAIVHTAYHLGAIRQMAKSLKANAK